MDGGYCPLFTAKLLSQEKLLLEIAILSPLSIKLNGQSLKLPSRRTEALFVYLLRNPQPHAREVLANLLWDELPQSRATGNLRVLIANLHKSLGPYMTITRQSIAFDGARALRCDLTDLEQVLMAARSEQAVEVGLSRRSADRLAHVLTGYQGELLPGFYLRGGQGFDEWLTTEREWLWTRAIAALSDLASAYLRLGDYQAGIEQAQRLVNFDPLREDGHQQLMQLLAANGQTNAALAHYQHCVQILDKEMGVPPSLATSELFAQIQQGVWQKPTPPIAVLPRMPATPHNLPREMTPFIGRETELEELARFLLDPAYPLVTLAGEGGGGKTRLALAAARHLQTYDSSPFPDGIWFVPLMTLQRGDAALCTAIAVAIGKAMGLIFHGPRTMDQQLLGFLQKRRCLLLLDNFEQLIPREASTSGEPSAGESSAIDFVIDLLEQAPQLQLLITSRIPLDLSSEFVVRLSGLPVPAVDLLADPATYASIRLFAERATRIAEYFHLERHLSEIGAICRLVAGLPLGIELAAAWSSSRTPMSILLALQANLDFLTTYRRDVPPRQRSMRAVFEYSWQLLSTAERQVLAQIASFKGGFNGAAALAVLAVGAGANGVPQNLARILDYLVHCSLLQQDEIGRYNIHTLLREYAAEKLEELSAASGEASDVAQRHSRYYLDLVGQAHIQGWYTRSALTPIHADLDNVRQAWQWASVHGDLDGLRLGWLGLWYFYQSSALFQEGEEAFRATLEGLQVQPAAGSELPIMVARLQVAHASFLNALGRYRDAVTVAQTATAFAEAAQDEAIKARGYAAWGTGLYRQAQYPAALVCLAQGRAAAQTAHLPLVEADLHKRLANTHQASLDFASAHRHYAQALALYRQHHHRPGEGEALNGLGWCCQQQQQLEEALYYLNHAHQIQQTIDDPHGLGMTLINLATVHEMLGDYSQAFANRHQALELLEQFDDPYQSTLVHHGLGVLYSRLGDYAIAEQHYLRSLELDQAMGDLDGVVWTQNNLGLLYNHRGQYKAALALHQEVLQTSIELRATTTQGLAWSRLGQDYYGLEELEASYDAFLNALAIQTELGQQVWAIESKSGLAATQLALHMADEAQAQVEEILDFLDAHTLDAAREPMLVYWNCYQVLDAKADPRAAHVLDTANKQLTDQAAKLTDQRLQHSFLENVKAHQALRQEYSHLYNRHT